MKDVLATEDLVLAASIICLCEARIKKPNGEHVVSKDSLFYLRSFLCDNGKACVPSRVLYCLHTARLNKAELRRLMFQENPQHPALLCEHGLKQDCVGATRPPRYFQRFDLSPINFFWKDCSSALHRRVKRQCVFF